MGTRHITRIISGGELKCCQYGQWDGYPTSAGKYLMEKIRTLNLDEFESALNSVKLVNCQELMRRGELDENVETFFTGAPLTDKLKRACEIYEDVYYRSSVADEKDMTVHESISARKKAFDKRVVAELGRDVLTDYYVATRDTGYKILGIIPLLDGNKGLTLWCDDYIEKNEGDWQIEGIYELNFDTDTFMLRYHGAQLNISFEAFRTFSSDDIEKLCEGFERVADEVFSEHEDHSKVIDVTDRVIAAVAG